MDVLRPKHALFNRMQQAVTQSGRHRKDNNQVDQTAYRYLSLWSDAFITAWVMQKDNSTWYLHDSDSYAIEW